MTGWLLAGFLAGLVLGGALGLLASAHRRGVLAGELSQLREAQARREEDQRRLEGAFAELSGRALRENTEQFLTVADHRLRQAHDAAQGDLARRQEAIAGLLDPLQRTLERYQEGLQALERDRQGAYQGMTATIGEIRRANELLQGETRNLASALRSPQVRGRWGEVQLRRVVELAGMVPHCDFDVQVPSPGPGGVLRPDMVVHLPGGGHVVVDAKAPLEAFLKAGATRDAAEQEALMGEHARHLRAHVDQMAGKAYWKHVAGSPEQVVVFLPGDALLAAALEHDPALYEHALGAGVLLATPTTLIALLRTAAFGWRQDALAAGARQLQELGTTLYDRLQTMAGHLAKVQRGLAGTVEAFNQAVGSFESRVLVTARRFPELGAGFDGDGLPPVPPVDTAPRLPRAPDLNAVPGP